MFAQRAAAEGRAGDPRVWGERFELVPEHFSREALPPSSAALASQLLESFCTMDSRAAA